MKYWENPFESVLTRRHLTEFVVLDKEDIDANMTSTKKSGQRKKMRLCEVEIARVSDLGQNDIRCRVRCHLGHLLEAGDNVLGYDLRTANVSGIDDDRTRAHNIGEQDVILVRKKFMISNSRRADRREWDLKRLAIKDDEKNNRAQKIANEERDFEHFKQDLEEDDVLRKDVNLYRTKAARRGARKTAGGADEDGENGEDEDEDDEENDLPEVPIDELNELLGGLTVDCGERAGGPCDEATQEGDELSEDDDL